MISLCAQAELNVWPLCPPTAPGWVVLNQGWSWVPSRPERVKEEQQLVQHLVSQLLQLFRNSEGTETPPACANVENQTPSLVVFVLFSF